MRELPVPRFVVDAMLGNVARDLRLLGYDALYARHMPDPQILRLCQAEQRVLATRDRSLAQRARPVPCVLVRGTEPRAQCLEVLGALRLGLSPEGPLTRCLACNGRLDALAPHEAWQRVPDHVGLTQQAFRVCPGCGRVYWKGSHTARLERRIGQILESLHSIRGQV